MGKRKVFVGKVISDKMQKTRVVSIMRLAKHPKYGRIIKKYNKYKVHDEENITKAGDMVRIEETRPLSKDKRFRIQQVIKKSSLPLTEIKEE